MKTSMGEKYCFRKIWANLGLRPYGIIVKDRNENSGTIVCLKIVYTYIMITKWGPLKW